MSEHHATVRWAREGATFTDNRYSRVHEWRFDGGLAVRASASPSIVRPPMSDPAAVDPEEAFVASLSSCHMLWFLSIAAERGFVVDAYDDEAFGALARQADGRQIMARVVLRPHVRFVEGHGATPAELAQLHEDAHHQCFLANAVRCEVLVEAR